MPFIRTTTNKTITKEELEVLKTSFGTSISLVSGKRESQLMLSFHADTPMTYQGSAEPLAMLEVSLFGKADPAELDRLTGALTDAVSQTLGIDPARIYVNYAEFDYWGVGGHNV